MIDNIFESRAELLHITDVVESLIIEIDTPLRNKLLGAIDVFNYENPQVDKPNIEANDLTIFKSYADLMPKKPDIPVIEITSEYADPI